MKIDAKEREVTIEGDFEKKEFFIDQKNTVHIIKILRNKLYSDKVLAVIREYITNAIDATVENNSTKPIEIHLPTETDSYFKVRDFGKGLSNEEIDNIFISYGNSTKRNSDSFTGCLGIGSKSAFSYAESFLINSVKNGVKTTYMSFLDESGLGSISMLSRASSQEHSGIEICVPVREADHEAFLTTFNFYKLALDFPFVCNREYGHKLPIFSSDVGIIHDGSNTYFNSDEVFVTKQSRHSGVFAFMGNVAYKIDRDWFEQNVDPSMLSYDHFCVFKVKMGEVEFSSNRESIEQTQANALVLKEYVQRFKEFFKSSIEVDFFSNSKDINYYKGLGLRIKFPTSTLENTTGQLFNLSSFEYELDFKKLLDNISSIVVKGLYESDNDDSARTKTLFADLDAFSYWRRDRNYKFGNSNSNYPMIVVGSGKASKDREVISRFKQKCISRGFGTMRKELYDEFPLCDFLKYLPGTGERTNSADYPLFFVVEPKDKTPEEFTTLMNSYGFKTLSIDYFKTDQEKKELDSYFSMIVPTDENDECVEIELQGKVTKKQIEAELLRYGIQIEDCMFFKNGDVTVNSPIKIKSSYNEEIHFTLLTGGHASASKKSTQIALKLFREEYKKTPILFGTTQGSFGVSYNSRKLFRTMIQDLLTETFKRLTFDECYYLRFSKLTFNSGSVTIEQSQNFGEFLCGSGFPVFSEFQSTVDEIHKVFKTAPSILEAFKNKKLGKCVQHLKSALKRYTTDCRVTVTEQRRKYIDELRDLIGYDFIPYYFYTKGATIDPNLELENYIIRIMSKIVKRQPLFFVLLEHICKTFCSSQGYYERKYVQNNVQREQFINFIKQNAIGSFNNGK